MRYTSDVRAAFSFVEVFFSEWFLFIREYSDDWFSSYIGNEEVIRVKVDRFFKGWRAVVLFCVWFDELCGTGVDFFQAVVKGRIQVRNRLVDRFRFVFYRCSWSRFW